MINIILVVANMCLQGGEQVDVSRYVVPTANVLELRAILRPAGGTLVVYSPGYEDRPARLTAEQPLGWIPFSEPVLCVKALGGPFEFNIQVRSVEYVD
jgi:hypothetical protein